MEVAQLDLPHSDGKNSLLQYHREARCLSISPPLRSAAGSELCCQGLTVIRTRASSDMFKLHSSCCSMDTLFPFTRVFSRSLGTRVSLDAPHMYVIPVQFVAHAGGGTALWLILPNQEEHLGRSRTPLVYVAMGLSTESGECSVPWGAPRCMWSFPPSARA